MKRYKTWEVIKMLSENPKLQFKNEDGHIITTEKVESHFLKYSNNKTEININNNLKLEAKWELIQESVTFEEVLNSDKECRVEHEILNDLRKEYCLDEDFDAQYLIEELNILEVFLPFTDCMYHLANLLNEIQLKEVIKNGRWYLE